MPEIIVPDSEQLPEQEHTPAYWLAIWDDLTQKMTPTAAATALGLSEQTIWRAVRRGEITPYQFSERKVYVTPRLVAEWAERYHRIPQAKPLPS